MWYHEWMLPVPVAVMHCHGLACGTGVLAVVILPLLGQGSDRALRAPGSFSVLHVWCDVQPGSIEGQLGALRHVRLGSLGFVEQLEALDNDRSTM